MKNDREWCAGEMKIAIAVGEVATGSRQGWSSNRPSQLGSLGCRCGSRPERAVRRRERSSRQLRKPARARKDDGKPWDEERGEGGIYVLGKRRGAVPAHLARSGGRQTRRGRHLDPDNISYSGESTVINPPRIADTNPSLSISRTIEPSAS